MFDTITHTFTYNHKHIVLQSCMQLYLDKRVHLQPHAYPPQHNISGKIKDAPSMDTLKSIIGMLYRELNIYPDLSPSYYIFPHILCIHSGYSLFQYNFPNCMCAWVCI
jgi:hypothetical protein